MAMPMGRMKKLLLAGSVLVLGIVLAWPFRKTGLEDGAAGRVEVAEQTPLRSQSPIERHAEKRTEMHTVAKMAGLSHSDTPVRASPVTSPFDLAGHPAFRGTVPVEPPYVPPTYQPNLTVEPADATGRAVYSAVDSVAESGEDSSQLRQRSGLIHIVSDGDTLDRLAERYLRDSGRGLEIFDLNRDRLTNPHLLQIGVELRIPPHLSRDID